MQSFSNSTFLVESLSSHDILEIFQLLREMGDDNVSLEIVDVGDMYRYPALSFSYKKSFRNNSKVHDFIKYLDKATSETGYPDIAYEDDDEWEVWVWDIPDEEEKRILTFLGGKDYFDISESTLFRVSESMSSHEVLEIRDGVREVRERMKKASDSTSFSLSIFQASGYSEVSLTCPSFATIVAEEELRNLKDLVSSALGTNPLRDEGNQGFWYNAKWRVPKESVGSLVSAFGGQKFIEF